MLPTDRYISTLELCVRAIEVDVSQTVNKAAYISWLDEGRIHYFRAKGIEYPSTSDLLFVVTKLQIEYGDPAQLGDRVAVDCWLTSQRSRSLEFQYEIRHAYQNTLLATASTQLLCSKQGRTIAIPMRWKTILATISGVTVQ